MSSAEGQTDLAKMEKGIDVSKWQGTIDWKKVADAGIKHVCIKMTEGGKFVDPKFVENWTGAKAAGINVNCYHYYRALASTPAEQLENIKENAKKVNFTPSRNILAIDVETIGNEHATPDQMADNLNALLLLIKEDSCLGFTPVIYTSHRIWDSQVNWSKYDFSVYPLWVAHWNVKSPILPQTWSKTKKTWIWWQHTSKGRIEGVSGNVDLDWVKCE